MKTIILKSKYLFLSLLFTFALSCSSEDGEDGAIGPQGIAGIDGVDGTDGEDGNANVTSLLLEDQTINTGENIYDVAGLTQAIFDTGFVFAYVTVNGNNYWEALPLSLAQEFALEIDRIEVGRITLKSTFTQSDLRLRFIFIEGNSITGKATNKNISKMTYTEAMNYLGLND